jgi:Ca2+-binding RTX toxin-like protein
MKLHGTGRADKLIGSASSDVISGGNGDDFLEGGAGSDTLIGGDGADKFVSRNGSGVDVIQDFNTLAGDRMLVDWYGSFSDIATLDKLTDGLAIHTVTGGTIHVSIADYDHNGTLDTIISNDSGDALVALNQSDLFGWSLMGG